jgi:phosphoglycerate dehydrogenase-like enzyme
MNHPPLINTSLQTKKSNKENVLLVVPKSLPNAYDPFISDIDAVNIIKVYDDRASILSKISGAHALVGCPRPIFDDEIISASEGSLRWLHCPGAGVEHFLTDGLINSDIVFTNGKIIQGPECADHAIALLLSLTRNIVRTLKADQESHFPRPIELLNKKALIIGVGGIGMCIAERLSAFGVQVTGVDDDYVPMLSFIKNIEKFDDLPELVGDADIIFMSAPHTFKTNKIINKELVKRFKKGSYFINVSRGGNVDVEALNFAVEENILAGVGLDVTDPEPLPNDHKLRTQENVVITSHIAGLSEFNRERSGLLVRENILRFARGENLINVVNKIAGY